MSYVASLKTVLNTRMLILVSVPLTTYYSSSECVGYRKWTFSRYQPTKRLCGLLYTVKHMTILYQLSFQPSIKCCTHKALRELVVMAFVCFMRRKSRKDTSGRLRVLHVATIDKGKVRAEAKQIPKQQALAPQKIASTAWPLDLDLAWIIALPSVETKKRKLLVSKQGI